MPINLASYKLSDLLNPRFRRRVKYLLLRPLGYQSHQWGRIEYNQDWKNYLSNLDYKNLNAFEISPGERTTWRDFGFKSYTSRQYPEYDVCKQTLDKSFDIIIADNVFEHVEKPYSAGKNVYSMLNPGGIFLIVTPFLIKLHGGGADYTRWTPKGLVGFLEECNFKCKNIAVKSWGNRSCVRANLKYWAPYGWHRSMKNEGNYPVNVWAYAKK